MALGEYDSDQHFLFHCVYVVMKVITERKVPECQYTQYSCEYTVSIWLAYSFISATLVYLIVYWGGYLTLVEWVGSDQDEMAGAVRSSS